MISCSRTQSQTWGQVPSVMMLLYMGGKLVSVGKKGIISDACAEAVFLWNYSI